MADSWAEFEKFLSESEEATRNVDASVMAAGSDEDKLAALHSRIVQMHEQLDVCLKQVEGTLAQAVPPSFTPHKYTTPSGRYEVEVAWGERRTWDQKMLAEMCGEFEGNDPEFVDRKIGIDKRAWDKADDADKKAFIAALTTKLGARSVTVTKVA